MCLQVAASLEEQAFTEAWGKKAKQVFPDANLHGFAPELQKLIKKINELGAANLPTTEREEVSVFICAKAES